MCWLRQHMHFLQAAVPASKMMPCINYASRIELWMRPVIAAAGCCPLAVWLHIISGSTFVAHVRCCFATPQAAAPPHLHHLLHHLLNWHLLLDLQQTMAATRCGQYRLKIADIVDQEHTMPAACTRDTDGSCCQRCCRRRTVCLTFTLTFTACTPLLGTELQESAAQSAARCRSV